MSRGYTPLRYTGATECTFRTPFAHIGTKVDLRITDRSLEVYSGHERITTHLLLPATAANEYRTDEADLPAGEKYQLWDKPRARQWAERIGPSALVVIDRIFESVHIVEQGLNPALAVLRLARRYSAERVEAACRIALAGPVRSPGYAHVHPILATGQDHTRADEAQPVEHGGYVRGASYYAGGEQ